MYLNQIGKSVLAISLIILVSSFSPKEKGTPEEGIYPLAQLQQLDLNAAGLKIQKKDIYNPGGVSLTNALVRLGGCTGSFISEQGLIITNHHCVFSAVAGHSNSEHNYLENGFYASTNEQELKTSIPCRITQSFEDVSAQVLEGVNDLETAQQKKDKIKENLDKLQKTEQEANPDLEIQISEMYKGKYYTLFRYKLLEDVRLVYVPPKAIGKFGGESDNWIWPRHNGDFSIVRVYEDGKPYTPEKFIPVNPKGTSENDFVFIMGYPGRTYRHMPAEYLTYQQKYVLPLISEWYDEQIDILKRDAGDDENLQLKYAGRIASLSNVTKNFKGKMQGLRRTDILQNRYTEQRALASVGNNDEKQVFKDLKELHNKKYDLATDVILGNQLLSSSGVLFASYFVSKYQSQLAGLSKSQKQDWFTKNAEALKGELRGRYRITNPDVDIKNFSRCLALMLEKNSEIGNKLFAQLGLESKRAIDIENGLRKLWSKSDFLNVKATRDLLEEKPLKFFKAKGMLIKMATTVAGILDPKMAEWNSVNTEIDALLPELASIKEKYTNSNFFPDANGTLRLTYGYVRGYEPGDGMVNDPFTTIRGIIEKAEDHGDYYMPADLLEKYREIEPADVLKHPKKNEVVVGVLYNLDTTGGNSGSPILDAYGKLVGVNFDRAFSATINDFAWNEEYSRSIGVDIRYVLYVMKYMHQADEILSEMGVDI